MTFLWFEFSYEVAGTEDTPELADRDEVVEESSRTGERTKSSSDTQDVVLIQKPDSLLVYLTWEFKSLHDPIRRWRNDLVPFDTLGPQPDVLYLSPVFPPAVPPPEASIG